MIAVVDYGVGNINAFLHIFKQLEIPAFRARTAEDMKRATRLILPGVGAFDDAMRKLGHSGLKDSLKGLAIERKVPLLGVCVGMQMLGESSEEGTMPGLGWIKGVVRKFAPEKIPHKTKSPHMGWNDVYPTQTHPLFHSLEGGARFYFLHSYHFICEEERNVLATTTYGETFVSVVGSENIYGIQCHPEKSHQWGMALLANFASI